MQHCKHYFDLLRPRQMPFCQEQRQQRGVQRYLTRHPNLRDVNNLARNFAEAVEDCTAKSYLIPANGIRGYLPSLPSR